MKYTERVYVGGIDPVKLPLSLVISRLKRFSSIGGLETEVDVTVPRGGEESGYFFANLTREVPELNEKEKKDEESASQLLIKKLHNTKWKGCKLKVELAQKSFLRRLEEEREELRELNSEQGMTKVSKNENLKLEDAKIPRNLKIRHKYGQEKLKIDTKPIEIRVSNGSHRNEFYKDNNSKRNRAIHVIFSEDDNDTSPYTPSPSSNEINQSQTSSVSGGGYISSDDTLLSNSKKGDSQESSIPSTNNDVKQNVYVWSDSDCGSRSSRGKDVDIQENSGTYVWSDTDSEDGSDDDQSLSLKTKNCPKFRVMDDCNEFKSALDDELLPDQDDNESVKFFHEQDDAVDLENETAQQMVVLSAMFPDLKPKKNAKKLTTENIIIPRFDPFRIPSESIANPIVEHAESEESLKDILQIVNESDSVTSDESERVDMDDDLSAEGTGVNEVFKSDIYKQNELESIFQSAREIERESASEKNAGSFSFGFSLPNDEITKNAVKDKGSSYDASSSSCIKNKLSEQKSPIESDESMGVDDDDSMSSFQARNDKDYQTPLPHVFQLLEDESVLERAERGFYDLNDVPEVENENDDEDWLTRRKALTNDWKQKRKRAKARSNVHLKKKRNVKK